MSLITSYATLQSELKEELDRADDTTSPFTRFIQSAEEAFMRDPRVRDMTSTTLAVSTEETALPTDFKAMVSLAHDGPTYYDSIEMVPVHRLPAWKSVTGTVSGPPAKAAILDDGSKIRVAPVPNAAYTLDMSYWRTITPLGGSVLQNWLLDAHSDIYLKGSVVEAAIYFRDEALHESARSELERKLAELDRMVVEKELSGPMVRVPLHTIG